ncbi:MAG: hypothetical protein ACE5Q6_11390 [Dehalococcoidia bacterium]
MTQEESSNNSAPQGLLMNMAWRTASWGLTITGFLGWVLAINAALSNHYIGAGVCLGASALAFAAVRHLFLRRTK